MITESIKRRLKDFSPGNASEQELCLAEIMQSYILVGLARAGFFKHAEFHGGTCLRIVHGIERFSEDLDFVLKLPDTNFKWKRYLEPLAREFEADGIEFKILDRSKADDAVKKAFLKNQSVGLQLVMELPYPRHKTQKVKVKLEIDTNPPAGSTFETAFLDYPFPSSITIQSLESSFASKIHALLCRSYLKGRDWYDFIWYMNKKCVPNLELLQNALIQNGPWEKKDIFLDNDWLREQLIEKITAIDWKEAQQDVSPFLLRKDLRVLEAWDREYFLHLIAKMKS